MTYVVFPAADADECRKCLWRWVPLGYKAFVLFDHGTLKDETLPSRLRDDGLLEGWVVVSPYRGWYASVNLLMALAFTRGADWAVCVGSDMDPDPAHLPRDIEDAARARFGGTCGVVQPAGDPWDEKGGLRAAERICGSPWIGREFFELCGGVVWDERYHHYFGDERLRETLLEDGYLWQPREYAHLHRHPTRERRRKPLYLGKTWKRDEKTFRADKKAGFPGRPWRRESS